MLPFFLEPSQSSPSPCCLVFSTWVISPTCMASPVTVKYRSRCDFWNSSRPPFSRGGPDDAQQAMNTDPASFKACPYGLQFRARRSSCTFSFRIPDATSDSLQTPQQHTPTASLTVAAPACLLTSWETLITAVLELFSPCALLILFILQVTAGLIFLKGTLSSPC